MAVLNLLIASLLVSTSLAIDDLPNTRAVESDERPSFQTLPLQLGTDKKEFYFHLYFHEIFNGPNKTTVSAVIPNSDFPNFGQINIFDVPLWDSLHENKLIARAHGTSIQSDQTTYGWHLSFDVVFEMPQLKGSTLQVLGRALQLTTPREWSIVGGTGEFTLAQGVVYGRSLSSPDESLWIELKIHGYYTPMQRPPWN